MTIRANKDGRFPQVAPGVYNVALGNMSQFRIAIIEDREEGGLMFGVVGHGAYRFAVPPHPGYVKEKLKVMEGDANNLADFIGDQLGYERAKRFGTYEPGLVTV